MTLLNLGLMIHAARAIPGIEDAYARVSSDRGMMHVCLICRHRSGKVFANQFAFLEREVSITRDKEAWWHTLSQSCVLGMRHMVTQHDDEAEERASLAEGARRVT